MDSEGRETKGNELLTQSVKTILNFDHDNVVFHVFETGVKRCLTRGEPTAVDPEHDGQQLFAGRVTLGCVRRKLLGHQNCIDQR